MGGNSPSEEEFRFHTVGEQLKAERERRGLSLADLAAKTRVPMRHLESIEKSDFGSLPGTTYTLGFVRSYARAVELDDASITAELRSELARSGHDGYQAPTQNYEPTDPDRVPSRWLAWTAALLGIVLVAAYLFWRSAAVEAPIATAPTLAKGKANQSSAATPPALPGNAEVVLTATDNVWVKIYDANNIRLFEKEMASGDSFTVPADADRPMIVTGRPQVLSVTVGGKAVPPLGAADRTIADVEISAAALLARANTVTPPAAPASAAGNTSDPDRN